MPECKKCGSEKAVKSGVVGGKQRYRCKVCGCSFREGDGRTNSSIVVKKALCTLLYTMAKGSFRMVGRILGINHTLVYRWVKAFDEDPQQADAPGLLQEMEFGELLHFLIVNKDRLGLSMPLTVAQGELWPGCSAIMILHHSTNSLGS